MAENNGIEIPEELLESISGGVLDDVSKNNLHSIVGIFKSSGISLEDTYAQLDYLSASNDWDEIKTLIGEYCAAL